MASDTLRAVDADRRASLVRYGGLVVIAAALLEMLTTTLSEFGFTADAIEVGDVVATYLLLGVVGVAAVYVRYEAEFEWPGKVGLAAIATGAVVGLASVLAGSVVGSLLNLVLVFGGAAFLAVGLWRAPSAPRSAAVLMGLAPGFAVLGIAAFSLAPESLLGPVLIVVLNGVWGAAWIVLGYHLWRRPERRADRPGTDSTGA